MKTKPKAKKATKAKAKVKVENVVDAEEVVTRKGKDYQFSVRITSKLKSAAQVRMIEENLNAFAEYVRFLILKDVKTHAAVEA